MAEESWEREVLRIIIDSEGKGASLEELLEHVDARNKVLIGLDEVNAALGTLTSQGLIARLRDGSFAATAGTAPMPAAFVPITRSEYDDAATAYHQGFIQALRELAEEQSDPDAAIWPKLQGTWPFAEGHFATDLELEEVASGLQRVVDALASHGFPVEAGGISVGPGFVEFLVTGRRADDANSILLLADRVFEEVAPSGASLVVNEWDPTTVGLGWTEIADEMEAGFFGNQAADDVLMSDSERPT